MQDRVPVNPGRVLITPENGSAAYYATMTRADNPTQEGTPLNKSNLLKDTTAALFGLGVNAVPDDVFNALGVFRNSVGNEYVWDKCTPNFTYTETAVTKNSNVSLLFTAGGTSARFRISDTLEEALLGVYTEQDVDVSNRTSLNGKYVRTSTVLYNNQPSAYEYIFYIAPSSTWAVYTSPNGYCFLSGSVYSNILSEHIHQAYVNSPDPNAYPVDDGYAYIFLGQLCDAFNQAKIVTGSYVGTGTNGSSNPTSITFDDVVPKLVVIHGGVGQAGSASPAVGICVLANLTTSFQAGGLVVTGGNSAKGAYAKLTGKTLSWYETTSNVGAAFQLNISNEPYFWIGLY